MTSWDPAQYLRHAGDRGRPFLDLLARIDVDDARTVVDLGCGPGQLMGVLRARFPDADLLGVDSSPAMVAAARDVVDDPRARVVLADASTWAPEGPVDVVVSNAMLQWLPDHVEVLERLSGVVRPGGAVAVQVPDNSSAPSHALMRGISARDPWAAHTDGVLHVRGTDPSTYLELFAGLGWSVDAWSTTYLHVLQGDDPVLDWVRGTGLRPVLDALPADLVPGFLDAYGAALREAYPRRPFGTVLPFRRTFCVAHAPVA